MKRIVLAVISFIFIICAFFFESGYCAKQTKKTPSIKRKIEFTTKDRFILVGDLYIPKNKKTTKPFVILLHSFSMSAHDWKNLATILRNEGYYVLAMDLRGHGRSILNEKLKIKSRFDFKAKDWQKLPDDFNQSINFVLSSYPNINKTQTIIVGADIGASAGIIGALKFKNEPEKIVLVSPMLNFKGLYIPIKIAKYKNAKFMILLSKSDKILFNLYTKTPPIIKTYPFGGSGNMLLKQNKDANNDIVKFINSK